MEGGKFQKMSLTPEILAMRRKDRVEAYELEEVSAGEWLERIRDVFGIRFIIAKRYEEADKVAIARGAKPIRGNIDVPWTETVQQEMQDCIGRLLQATRSDVAHFFKLGLESMPFQERVDISLQYPSIINHNIVDRGEQYNPEVMAGKMCDVFFDEKKVPEKLFSVCVREHVRWVERQKSVLLERTRKEREELFVQLVRIEEACPSFQANRAYILLQDVEIDAIDPLQFGLADRCGDWQPTKNLIRVSLGVPEGHVVDVLAHEYMHACSGSMITNNGRDESFDHEQKSGVSIPRVRTDDRMINNLRWMNEAITEKLTMAWVGMNEDTNDTYRSERALLSRIISEVGLTDAELYTAYFEDYVKKPDGEHRLPALRNIFRKIDEHYGKGFLAKIDVAVAFLGTEHKGVAENGAKEVLRIWDDTENDFHLFLSECYERYITNMRPRNA